MKLLHRLFTLVILALVLAPPSHSMPDGTVSTATLPNGLKIIIREGHEINLAAIDIWIRSGSANETAENNGITHLIEHMIFKSTRKYGPGQLDREMEGLGAELNGGTSKDYVHFYTTVASEHLPKALELLSDAVMHPQFDQDELKKELQVVLDEIARSESDPVRSAFAMFSQAAWASHPYRFTATGTRDSVNRISRDDLAAYYKKYFIPSNMCIVIAGDVSQNRAIEMVKNAFSDFESKSTGLKAPISSEPPLTSPREQSFISTSGQSALVFGYYAPPVSDFREACIMDVIMTILGDSSRGRICDALTSKGIRYDRIQTDYMTQRDQTTASVLISAANADIDSIPAILRSEFKRLATEPASSSEVMQAVRLLAGSDLFDQETFSGQAKTLGLYDSIGSPDMALKYTPTLMNLSPNDIMPVAKKYFTDNYILVTIKPEQANK